MLTGAVHVDTWSGAYVKHRALHRRGDGSDDAGLLPDDIRYGVLVLTDGRKYAVLRFDIAVPVRT